MDRSSQRGAADFLYSRLPSLRATYFDAEVSKALQLGRLDRIVRVTQPSKASLSEVRNSVLGRGVLFLEPQMEADGRQFQLTFQQMVLPAAMIDILYYLLGSEFQEICRPILGGACAADAILIHRALNSAVNKALNDFVPKEEALKQARAISKFLKAGGRMLTDGEEDGDDDAVADGDDRNTLEHRRDRRERHRALARMAAEINNQTILAFWDWQIALPKTLDGFTTYRSTARKLYAYHQSGLASLTQSSISEAVSLTKDLSYGSDAGGDIDLDERAIDRDVVDGWNSPLTPILIEQIEANTWFKNDEARELVHLVFSVGADPSNSDDLTDAKSLFGSSMPDRKFALTLARYICFGGLQDKLIHSRKQRRLDTLSYQSLVIAFAHIIDDLKMASLAVAWRLRESKSLVSIQIVAAHEPEVIAKMFSEINKPSTVTNISADTEKMARIYSSAVGETELGKIMKESSRITRGDFKSNGDEERTNGLANGALCTAELIGELREVSSWIEAPQIDAAYITDEQFFRERFEKIYGKNCR